MIQEGHMKDFECILGDSEILAEQLIWYLSPVCVAAVFCLLLGVDFFVHLWARAHPFDL